MITCAKTSSATYRDRTTSIGCVAFLTTPRKLVLACDPGRAEFRTNTTSGLLILILISISRGHHHCDTHHDTSRCDASWWVSSLDLIFGRAPPSSMSWQSGHDGMQLQLYYASIIVPSYISIFRRSRHSYYVLLHSSSY